MHGVAAWRGETIAVIDLDLYLSDTSISSPDGILLVANHAELTVGLLVPGIGPIITVQLEQMLPSTTQAGMAKGIYAGASVLDIPALLAGIVQQIERAALYG